MSFYIRTSRPKFTVSFINLTAIAVYVTIIDVGNWERISNRRFRFKLQTIKNWKFKYLLDVVTPCRASSYYKCCPFSTISRLNKGGAENL
jgi:hypothetical protein